MKKNTHQISDSEWEIMLILWKEHPLTSREIIENLEKKKEWKPTTIKTLLARLVEKGIISYEKMGKVFSYSPSVTQEECMKEKNKLFLKKFYKGGLKSLIASFLDTEDLSTDEINELKQILEKKKK